ncbi:hypothetical protein BH11PLA1_BH11PLA1_16380 [soil metagenome]
MPTPRRLNPSDFQAARRRSSRRWEDHLAPRGTVVRVYVVSAAVAIGFSATIIFYGSGVFGRSSGSRLLASSNAVTPEGRAVCLVSSGDTHFVRVSQPGVAHYQQSPGVSLLSGVPGWAAIPGGNEPSETTVARGWPFPEFVDHPRMQMVWWPGVILNTLVHALGVLCVLAPLVATVQRERAQRSLQRAAARGECANCGYARTGLAKQDRCPECGRAPDEIAWEMMGGTSAR